MLGGRRWGVGRFVRSVRLKSLQPAALGTVGDRGMGRVLIQPGDLVKNSAQNCQLWLGLTSGP